MAILRACALAMIIGTLCGAFFTHIYHNNKAQALADVQRKAWESNNESIRASSDHWQAELNAANSREPDVITRRVYVKAPVQTAKCDAVDAGKSAVEYRIDGATIRDIERIAARAEQQYRECSHRLRAWQDGYNTESN